MQVPSGLSYRRLWLLQKALKAALHVQGPLHSAAKGAHARSGQLPPRSPMRPAHVQRHAAHSRCWDEMLLARTLHRTCRLAECAAPAALCAHLVRNCIEDRAINPLWGPFDKPNVLRDMSTKPRRSARNKEHPVADAEAGSQVSFHS